MQPTRKKPRAADAGRYASGYKAASVVWDRTAAQLTRALGEVLRAVSD